MADSRPTLTGERQYKALAIRSQFLLYARELELCEARARIAVLERDKLEREAQTLEADFLAELEAPPGARFNWATLTYDLPTDERQASAGAELARPRKGNGAPASAGI
jgi:hypothetical protein